MYRDRRASRTSIDEDTSPNAQANTNALPMNAAREATSVVFATTTDTKPSSIGTPEPARTRRYAFRASPPIVAVGVVSFTASPARRTGNRSPKPGRRRGKASRHASVLKRFVTTWGSKISGRRQESLRSSVTSVEIPISHTSQTTISAPARTASGRSAFTSMADPWETARDES